MSNHIELIIMPKLGLTMESGKVIEWLIEPGQSVSTDDEIVEIETEKITNSVNANSSGILKRRIINAGETAAVGTVLGVIADANTTDNEIDTLLTAIAKRL